MPQDTDTQPPGKQPPREGAVRGESKIHPHPATGRGGDTSDPHTERQLDHGLEETFPASDPVSISPGAD